MTGTLHVRCLLIGLVSLGLVGGVGRTFAQSSGVQYFEATIRPVLVTHCYECHSKESGKARGGLRVDSRDALARGGDSGPAVVPKSLERSSLYQAMLYHDDGYQMPPKGKLPASTIESVRRWILMGAPDPRATEINPDTASEIDIEAGREFWAYRTLAEATPPANNGVWARTSIDQFVAQRLQQENLSPVSDATPQVLVRRLWFVLTGLPPTPAEAKQWQEKLAAAVDTTARQKVIAALVDTLLASPHYGERWGRHWLDVARYAESTGGDQNNVFQHAWRYRDWVIDAFNSDKPFDQFVREQIAGDLLPIAHDAEWADNVIATGFLAIGEKSVGQEDTQQYFADLVDEQLDTTTRAFLATTVACARCHDHKFDPIPQEDYYALAGVFRSTETHYGLLKAQARQATTLLDLTGLGPPPGSPKLSKQELAALVKARDDAEQAVNDAMTKIRGGENVFRGALRRLRSQRDETEAALQAYSQNGRPRVFAMGTQDRDDPLPTRLLVRGELDKPAQLVPRGVLQVLSSPGKHRLPSRLRGSGRVELADWIASAENPLTARVIVNRVWHWMFGRGLVRTVDDFGQAGDEPTHPELLDYLAGEFIAHDWSVKWLVKEIALSRTWQLSSNYNEANFATDPENELLWRAHKRRLEAEAIRDAMLAASGELERERPLGTYLREVGEGGVGQNVFEPVVRAIDANTRSVYLPRVRAVLPEFLATFDAPDAGLVTGSRDTTMNPLQALYLLNSEFVQQQAIRMAEQLWFLPPEEQVRDAYRLAYSREPTDEEMRLALDFLVDVDETSTEASIASPRQGAAGGGFGRRGRGRFGGGATDEPNVAASNQAAMSPIEIYCQALLSSMEFQMID